MTVDFHLQDEDLLYNGWSDPCHERGRLHDPVQRCQQQVVRQDHPAIATKSGYNASPVGSAAVTGIAVVCGPVSLPVADTGQTGCYWNNAGTWTLDSGCSQSYLAGDANYPFGQDANYVNKPVARSFTGPTQDATYTGDYTTKDNVTGLVWKTCSEGYSGSTCATVVTTTCPMGWTGASCDHADWISAGIACNALNSANSGAGYARHTDWRLPSSEELATLPDYSKTVGPLIDTGLFPGTLSDYYWSATTLASTTSSGWGVQFSGGGGPLITGKISGYYVRCVSGP